MASIRDPNPVIFFEPKALYRGAEGMVPVEDYTVKVLKKNYFKLEKLFFKKKLKNSNIKHKYFIYFSINLKTNTIIKHIIS